MCQLGPGLPRLAPPVTALPFVCPMNASPLSFCNKMLLPASLCHKRSTLAAVYGLLLPSTCQLGPGLPRLPPPTTLVPFISQIAVAPLLF